MTNLEEAIESLTDVVLNHHEMTTDGVITRVQLANGIVKQTLAHIKAIYDEIHGEDGYDRGFTKEETIGVLESWSHKAHCYDSILEALNLPAQEDYNA